MYTRHALAETTLGALTLVASDDAIIGVYFPGHWYLPPSESIGERVELGSDALLSRAAGQLGEYLAGSRTSFDLRVATAGNPLQEQVWEILKEIPFGSTTTYGAIAERLGDKAVSGNPRPSRASSRGVHRQAEEGGDAPASTTDDNAARCPRGGAQQAMGLPATARALSQAVGQAVGHNPVSIIVPCHRVVGSTGRLTGFAGGLERKRRLLELEEPAPVRAGRLF